MANIILNGKIQAPWTRLKKSKTYLPASGLTCIGDTNIAEQKNKWKDEGEKNNYIYAES
jgi:hypothetical protein